MNARKIKALTQPLYLVRLDYDPSQLTFHIIGSQRRVYQIVFPKADVPDCTCPDQVQRKACCKHIHFVACKILHMDPPLWRLLASDSQGHDLEKVYNDILRELPHLHVAAPEDLNRRYEAFCSIENGTALDKSKGATNDNDKDNENARNTDCCICLYSFDESGGALFTCSRCRNAVHLQCWQQWQSANSSGRCIFCREPAQKTLITRDQYGVQL